jgi:chromosomal replication initiation ATPase DnaA
MTTLISSIQDIKEAANSQKEPLSKEAIEQLHIDIKTNIAQQKFQIMWQIFEKVCKLYNQDPVLIYSKNKRRHTPAVSIRQISMVLFRNELPIAFYSQSLCAEFFELEHASVIHSHKVVKSMVQTNRAYREFTKNILKDVKL